MEKSKKNLLVFAILGILVIAGFVYLPNLGKLGLVRDDWNNFYNAVIRSPEKLIDHYMSDRPADGYLICEVFKILGTDYHAYIALNLVFRILSAIFVTLTLYRIWPDHQAAAGLAGILSVIFPGFLQQIDGIAYVPHQLAMLSFCFSLYLTAVCLTTRKLWLRVILTIPAVAFSLVNMVLMEYYLGMEIYRVGLIFICVSREKSSNKNRTLLRTVRKYLPYLAGMLLFVYWRTFLFNATRNGTGVIDEVVRPLLDHPRFEGMILLARYLKNIWKLFVGTWTVPVYNLINGTDAKTFFGSARFALGCAVFGGLISFLLLPAATDTEDKSGWRGEWIRFGLICGSLTVLPLTMSSRDITFSASLDRFSWPGSLAAVMVVVALVSYIRGSVLRSLAAAVLVFLSAFVQVRNVENYAVIWSETQDFWQQLIWRAPGLKPETTLLTAGAFSAEEDYEIFAPANLIYYPHGNGYAIIGAEVLNNGTVHQVEMGKTDKRTIREIYVGKDYTQLLALSKPSSQSCLHVINGSNPIYSNREWSKITEVGAYSRLDQIVLDPEIPAAVPFFLKEDPEINWCYYYEAIDRNMQAEDPGTAAALADEAIEKGFWAEDYVEWVPVIEAYTESGTPEKAERFIAILQQDEYLAHSACTYFTNKNDRAYKDILEMICE